MKRTCLLAALMVCVGGLAKAEDLYLDDGQVYVIDYTIEGALWIGNATVSLYNPAHITDFTITGSGAILDIFGGKIDYMLMVSDTSGSGLPDGIVTIYGTEFAVDGVPVAPDTPELFLENQTLSGVYEDGTPFAIVVACAESGNAGYSHYQTLKLGWVVQQPKIEVSLVDYDFGQADIGTEVLSTITVTNAGNANLQIQSLSVVQDEPVQFGFTPLQVMPVTLEPGASMDVEIWFAPAIEGQSAATLQIANSDPNAPLVEVTLSGEGLAVELEPEEQIRAILDVLEQGFINGTIKGAGMGRCAFNRALIFTKSLIISKRLIDADYDIYALIVLMNVEKKCDGNNRPADFIRGPDVPVLHGMIAELIETLKADCDPNRGLCRILKQ